MTHTMFSLSHTRTFVLSFALLAWGLLGCTPSPPTDANDVLDYLRNASVGAQLRRLDAPSQTFVDQLLGIRAKIHAAQKPILRSVDALWPLDSPKWNDMKALEKQQKALQTWLADAKEASTKKPTRAELITQFEQALAKAPAHEASLKAPEQRIQWLAKIRDSLHLARTEQECKQIAQLHVDLVSWILTNKQQMAAKAKGLQFTTPALTAQAKDRWKQLHLFLKKLPRAVHLPAFQELATYEITRAKAIQEKQSLRKKGIRDVATLRQYRRLEIKLHYFDRIIDIMRKEKETHDKKQKAAKKTPGK